MTETIVKFLLQETNSSIITRVLQIKDTNM